MFNFGKIVLKKFSKILGIVKKVLEKIRLESVLEKFKSCEKSFGECWILLKKVLKYLNIVKKIGKN